tara:strand:- start:346 stop:714 length:369 start_codon:yes stop_codon:yes gene_type:complete
MILILNNDNIDINQLVKEKNKLSFHCGSHRMNGLYFKYDKLLTENNNNFLLMIKDNIFPIFKKLNIENRINRIKGNNYIDIIKNDITKRIFNDKNKYLILSFKSVNDNNYIKIHISQWNPPK